MPEYETDLEIPDDEEEDVRTDEDRNILDTVADKVTEVVYKDDDTSQADLIEDRRQVNQDIVEPTDPEVIKKAYQTFRRIKQEEKAQELGYSDNEELIQSTQVEVDLSKGFDELVYEFCVALELLHDDFVERIDMRNGDEKTNPIIETEEPTMTQIVQQEIGEENNITILHGARNIIYNLSEQLGYSPEERRFVQIVHRIAAKENQLYAHTVVDDVVIINKTLSE